MIKVGKELKNLSGEWLNRSEFEEYINDYYSNPKEYNLDEDNDYYKAISYAYYHLDEAYELYDNEFEQ
jgi:Zn-finger nucleic acid-binding protein